MRDFGLVKYAAKVIGLKPKRQKHALRAYLIYDKESLIAADIFFQKGVAGAIFFDLSVVYEAFAKDRYSSYEAFLDAFVTHSKIYEKFESARGIVLISDLRKNRLDKVASQALINITILFANLNEFLGRDAEVLVEEDWRYLHRRYLKKQRIISAFGSGLSFVAGLGSAVLLSFNVIQLLPNVLASLLSLLTVLLIPVGLLGGIILAIRAGYYTHHLSWASKQDNLKWR